MGEKPAHQPDRKESKDMETISPTADTSAADTAADTAATAAPTAAERRDAARAAFADALASGIYDRGTLVAAFTATPTPVADWNAAIGAAVAEHGVGNTTLVELIGSGILADLPERSGSASTADPTAALTRRLSALRHTADVATAVLAAVNAAIGETADAATAAGLDPDAVAADPDTVPAAVTRFAAIDVATIGTRGSSDPAKRVSEPDDYRDGATFHHADRDGTVHTLRVDGKAFIVDGIPTDASSPSAAAGIAAGGERNAYTYWHRGDHA